MERKFQERGDKLTFSNNDDFGNRSDKSGTEGSNNKESSAFHSELFAMQMDARLSRGGPGGGHPAPPRPEPPRPQPVPRPQPAPRPEPPRPQPVPRPEPPRPQPVPRPEPPRPQPVPRPEPPRPQPVPRPEPPRPQPVPRPEPPHPQPEPPKPQPVPRPEPPHPKPEPPRPEPHPPRPEPPHPKPEPPKPEPHPPRPEPPHPKPEPPKPEPHPPRPEPPHPKPEPPKPEPHPPKPQPVPRPEPPHPHPPKPEPPRPPRPEPPRPEPPHPKPNPHPEPRPPRPEPPRHEPPHPPNPGDRHPFHDGQQFRPPQGQHWGWQDGDRWRRGFDPWFWQQSPNFAVWQPTLNREARYIAGLLDRGDFRDARRELNAELYDLRCDRYAQNELLREISLYSRLGRLNCNNWNPDRGTWDDVVVVEPPPPVPEPQPEPIPPEVPPEQPPPVVVYDNDGWEKQEATNIATLLDSGDAQGAAVELKRDLYALRGNLDGQNDLLKLVDSSDKKNAGSDLKLGPWDNSTGTYSTIEILPAGSDQGTGIQISTYPNATDAPPDLPQSPPYPTDNHPFYDGQQLSVPDGSALGWQDPDKWAAGWDDWFFSQSPNYDKWNDTIATEAQRIADRLDTGDAQGAADELNAQLYDLRGDRYAQDQLIKQVQKLEQADKGANLQLGNWNPTSGTWDAITVKPAQGEPLAVTAYDGDSWQDQEAKAVNDLLTGGNAQGAADQLQADIFSLRGNISAQNALLKKIDAADTKNDGADLILGHWDDTIGTYTSVELLPQGSQVGDGYKITLYPDLNPPSTDVPPDQPPVQQPDQPANQAPDQAPVNDSDQ